MDNQLESNKGDDGEIFMPLPEIITACVISQRHGMELVKQSIDNLYENVDYIFVQSEDNLDREFGDYFAKHEVQYFNHPWIETPIQSQHGPIGPFALYKNTLVNRTKPGWVLSLDHDEIPTKEMAEGLKDIVKQSKWGTNHDSVVFHSAGIKDGIVTNPGIGKMLLHVKLRDPWFGRCHNHFRPGLYRKEIVSDLVYIHYKTEEDLLYTTTRNVILGGGSDNKENLSGLWTPLHEWMTKNNFTAYKDVHRYMERGNVDSWFKDWMQKAYELEWSDANEYKNFKRLYIKLHPEEAW